MEASPAAPRPPVVGEHPHGYGPVYDLDPTGRALMDAYETMQSMAGGLIPKLTERAEG